MIANPDGNWFQQRLAALLGHRSPEPPPAAVSAKTLDAQAATRARLLADTMAFREEHVRNQGRLPG